MWKAINKVLDKDQNHSPPLSIIHKGQRVDKLNEITEAFNRHFISTGQDLAANNETTQKQSVTTSAVIFNQSSL